jgi:hypothetical protein
MSEPADEPVNRAVCRVYRGEALVGYTLPARPRRCAGSTRACSGSDAGLRHSSLSLRSSAAWPSASMRASTRTIKTAQ